MYKENTPITLLKHYIEPLEFSSYIALLKVIL
jgi:hypothetical protein